MPQVKFIEFNGTEHNIDANVGESIMVAATSNLVPGIDADCGGACACGTCHCFVSDGSQVLTGELNPLEESMLGMRPDRADNSRLSCQIDVTEEMDGLVVHLPEYQM